jgi:hypothetical protein
LVASCFIGSVRNRKRTGSASSGTEICFTADAGLRGGARFRRQQATDFTALQAQFKMPKCPVGEMSCLAADVRQCGSCSPSTTSDATDQIASSCSSRSQENLPASA